MSEIDRLEPRVVLPGHGRPMTGPVLSPALRGLDEQLNPVSSTRAGSSGDHKLTERILNFFDYSQRAR